MPAFTAIGAYVAGTVFGLVGTAAVVVGALVATGAAYITSRIINGNPNKGNNSSPGSQGGRVQVPPATNNKIPVLYGNAYVNGTITDARLKSTDQKINDTMYYCIVLSETCNNVSAAYVVDNVYWNDLRLTAVDATTNAHKVKDGRKTVDGPGEDFIDTNFIVDNKSLVELRVYAGSTAAADQIYPAQSTGNTTPAYTFWAGNDGSWDSTYKMDGLVFAIVKVTYNGEKGFTGLPNMTFQLNNNISNPADVWYDYMTGQRYGANIDSSYIDSSARTAWKNFCDEDIVYTDKDGTTNQYTTRYSINGLIDTNRSVKENIDIIMQNGGAWLSYDVSSGLWSPIIKKAVTAGELGLPLTYFTASRSGSTLTVTNFPAGRIEAGQLLYNSSGTLIGTISAQLTPSLGETAGQLGRYTTSTSGSISSTTFYTLPATMLSFTDDNILSGITISSTRLDDLYNSYEAEFYDKYNKDQKSYARDSIDAGERNPNEPDNQLRLSLDLCNNSVQADLLAKLELAQSRDDLVVEFTTNFYGIQAQAGDVISVYSDLYDWAPKYFRVMRVKEQETEEGGLVAQIQALEYNPDVYTVEPLTEFTTSANIGIGVYGASPNLPQPPVVYVTEIDTNVAIPNFQMQIQIPTTGGPYDEIELFYTEGWDPMDITGWIDNNSTPGTYSGVAGNVMTVTSTPYGAINAGDYFDLGGVAVVNQLTNTPASKTYSSGGAIRTNTVVLNNVTGLLIGNNLMGTGLGTFGSHITAIDAGTNTVTLSRAFDAQAAGTYTITGGLGTYTVNTTIATSGTDTLYDLPVDSDYVYLKKVTPEGNNPTFTNGETITVVITEVPANTQTYRRWFLKARMGIKKRFGSFSTPTITDRDGNFRYTPNPVASGSLGDLSDVTLTSPELGDFLWYNGTDWVNENETRVDTTARTLRLTRENTAVGEDYEDEVTLRLNDRVTDVNNNNNDEGGPAIRFERSNSTSAAPVAFGQIAMEWFGTTNDHRFRVVTSTDEFNPGTGTPPPYPNSTVLIESTRKYTNINKGVLYVDKTNNRVGINNTSPSYELHIDNGTDSITQFAMTNNERTFLLSNNGGDDLLSFNYGGSNRLQFNTSNQWFNSGYTGINTSTPAYTLDVNGDANIDNNLYVTGSTYLGNNYINDVTNVIGEFKVTNNSVDNLFVDHTTGYVGINDNTPSYNLDVNGTANIETSLTVPSISTLTGDDLTITAFSGRDLTISTTAAADPVTVVRNLSTTNDSIRTLTVRANSTGTPVVGFGNFFEFETESTPGTFVRSGYINNKSTGDNGSGVLDEFNMSFGVMSGGVSTERMVLDNLGNLQIDGDLTVDGNGYIKGTNLVLNSDGTGTEDITITFERGASDAVIKWNDTTTDRFEFNRPITTENQYGIRVSQDLFGTGYHGAVVAGTTGTIYTGGDFTFQRNGGTYASNNATISVDRAASATDSYITWNEADVAWNISNSVTIADNLNVANGVLYVDDTNNIIGVNTTTPGTTTPGVALEVTGGKIFANGYDILASGGGFLNGPVKTGYIENNAQTYPTVIGVQYSPNLQTWSGTSQVTVFGFGDTYARTVKLQIQMSKGTDHHYIEITIIHDGTTIWWSGSNEMITNTALMTFDDVIYDSGSVKLLGTPTSTGSLKVLINATLFDIT